MHATHPHNGHAINGDLPIPEARFTLPLPNGANGVVTPAAAPPSPNGDCGEQTAGPPSPNGEKGRDRNGRFARGNKGGPGNPFARRVGRLRSQLLNLVTEADLREVARKLVEQARTGNLSGGERNRLVELRVRHRDASLLPSGGESASERGQRLGVGVALRAPRGVRTLAYHSAP